MAAKKAKKDENVVQLNPEVEEFDAPRYEVAKFKGKHVKLARKIVRKIAGSPELRGVLRETQENSQRLASLNSAFGEKLEAYTSIDEALEKDEEVRRIGAELSGARQVANAAQFSLIQTGVNVALDDEESGAARLLDKLIADLAGLDGPDALDEEEGDVYTEVVRALFRSESFKGFLHSFSATRAELGPRLSTLFGTATAGGSENSQT